MAERGGTRGERSVGKEARGASARRSPGGLAHGRHGHADREGSAIASLGHLIAGFFSRPLAWLGRLASSLRGGGYSSAEQERRSCLQ